MRKKTRQRTYRPVSRRAKQTQRQYRDLKKQLCDATLRSRWNNRRTLQENISQFTLRDFEDRLADDEELAQRTVPKALNERELVLLHALYKKHGDNVQAMVRDKKLNVYQWTLGQCEKLLLKFKQQHICSTAKKYLLPKFSPPPLPVTPPAVAGAAPPAVTAATPSAVAAAPAVPAVPSRVSAATATAAAATPAAAGTAPSAVAAAIAPLGSACCDASSCRGAASAGATAAAALPSSSRVARDLPDRRRRRRAERTERHRRGAATPHDGPNTQE